VRTRSQLHIFEIIAADIDVEEDEVVVNILLAQNVFEIVLGGTKAFGRLGFSSQESSAKLNTATPASPSRSASSGRSNRPFVAI
jgi:hypothetical protein